MDSKRKKQPIRQIIIHPLSETVNIVGSSIGDGGRSCEVHKVCGLELEKDSVVRLRVIQTMVDGKEETAIGVYWVTDGIDRCLVGFLQRHYLTRKEKYHGKLAQVIDLYSLHDESLVKRGKVHKNHGFAVAVLIDTHFLSDDYKTHKPGVVKKVITADDWISSKKQKN